MRRIFLLLTLVLLGAVPAVKAQDETSHNFKVAKNMQVFNEIYSYLDMMYIDTLNADDVVGTAIKAMLRSLDPYTVYYPEEKVQELKTMYTGKYVGMGSLIRYNSKLKRVVVDEPYAGTPAAEAGLKKGDIILSVDDSVMTDKDVSYVSSHLRGDAGTTFVLKVKRPSTDKVMSFKITRRAIDMEPISYYGVRNDGIGYLQLGSFTDGCAKDVRRAFIEMKDKGMKGFVLDLRSNGGGSVQEAVNIVNMFVPKGVTILKQRGRMKRDNRDYLSTVEPLDTVMPMVVLVDDDTASASEITCGSLQDLDRALVLGTRTYGKGLVQGTMDISYNGQMKFTTSKYYIPSGRCIQAINYKHDGGGYKEHIPDSLTRVFYTRNGREVRDGGGIKPDIELKPDSLPNIAYYLTISGMDSTEVMLDYVVDYIAKHPTIAPAGEFMITDDDFAQFKQLAIDYGFTYDAESERVLGTLKKAMTFEGYLDEAKEEFEALEKKLKHNLAKDLDRHKELIKQLITTEIVGAYYFKAGTVQNSLNYDKQMKEACRLINNPDEYRSVLAAPKTPQQPQQQR